LMQGAFVYITVCICLPTYSITRISLSPTILQRSAAHARWTPNVESLRGMPAGQNADFTLRKKTSRTVDLLFVSGRAWGVYSLRPDNGLNLLNYNGDTKEL